MSRLKIAAVFVLLMATFAAAQRPQPPRSGGGTSPQQAQAPRAPTFIKWWQDDKVKPELGLTSDQSNRIEEIFQSMRPKLTADKDELDRLEKHLSAMVADDAVSEADVAKQVDLVETSRAELAKARTMMFFRMHRILSPDQRTKLTALREKRERERDGAHRR